MRAASSVMSCKSFVLQGTHFLDDNSKIERKKKIDSRNKFYQTPTVKDVVGRRTFVGSAKCSACARRVLNLIYLRIYPKCNRVKSVNEGNNDRKRRNRYRGNYRVGVYE